VGERLPLFQISILRCVTDKLLIGADRALDKGARKDSEKWPSHCIALGFSSFPRRYFAGIAFHINVFVLFILIPLFA
jgi:hypothetical protein